MNFLGIVKLGANIALGIGNQAIIGSLTKQMVADCPNKIVQICSRFASTSLAAVATAACSNNVNQTIDQVAALINNMKESAKKEEEPAPQEA